MTVKTKYDFQQMVTVKHDPDRCKRMITGITVWAGGNVRYCLQYGGSEMWVFEFEIENREEKRRVGFVK